MLKKPPARGISCCYDSSRREETRPEESVDLRQSRNECLLSHNTRKSKQQRSRGRTSCTGRGIMMDNVRKTRRKKILMKGQSKK